MSHHARHSQVEGAALQEGWVIANHILVSFHVAFISSVLALPATSILKWEVLKFVFVSPETLVSAVFMGVSFHLGIALHEMGHFLTAARLNALNDSVLPEVKQRLEAPWPSRWLFYLTMIARIPYGAAPGVKREGLNYYPDAPYNLAVAAAGPRASRNVALATLPIAIALLVLGLSSDIVWAIYAGRLLLGIGVVCFLDFRLADPGKYRAFRERELAAADKAKAVGEVSGWLALAAKAKAAMLEGRMQRATHPVLGSVTAPWQFRNSGMGGRHTEKEYPESNVSMQEAMFLILRADGYREAQELTVRLQNRLKEIIEGEEGCRVMGIGLEGGLAPYIDKGDFPLPEMRLWAMMKRAIAECGCRPGEDVAIALDPAASELEIAYREENAVPDAVGSYLFWRDKAKTVLDRDALLEVYVTAIEKYEIPLLSIEDGFSENDHEGWRLLKERLGERLFIIGDDLVTTNDKTIEIAADAGLINCALIKANQIGTLYETLLAMLVALGKNLELVVSHRSKSPNDDMEAHIALAANALGLKAGGGSNTERLVKYQAVSERLLALDEGEQQGGLGEGEQALVRHLRAYEEPTNAGIPTVGATAELTLSGSGVMLALRGATPLGTSAGSGEAIHLVDSTIERAEYREVIERHPALFRDVELGVHAFKKDVDEARIRAENDPELLALFQRARRYGGKGCLNAVESVTHIVAPYFQGKDAASLTLLDLDRALLKLELQTAKRRGKLAEDADEAECVRVMQRKQNLGMNAILSVSLALGRGIARVHGKELFELLREEMMAVIDRVAASHDVAISGGRFEDYVRALAEVAGKAEVPLHQLLRDASGLYGEAPKAAVRRAPKAPNVEQEPEIVAEIVPPHAAAQEVLRAIAERLGNGYEHDVHHGLRHARDLLARAEALATELDVAERVDWRVLAAAVSLHDVAAAETTSHGKAGAERARELLGELPGFSHDAVERVADSIVLHEDKSLTGVDRRKGAGLEAQLLYDADQLDAFGEKGIYRYVAVYSQRNTPLERIAVDARARYQTLSFDVTRAHASRDFDFTMSFVDRLAEQAPADDRMVGAHGVARFIQNHATEDPVNIAELALAELSRAKDDSADYRFAVEYFRALYETYAGRPPAAEERPLPSDEDALLEQLDAELFAALVGKDPPDIAGAIRPYLVAKARLGRWERPFGVVNNRLFLQGDVLVVPYVLGPDMVIHVLEAGTARAPVVHRAPPGTIFTDEYVLGLAGASGTPIDLETPLYVFDPDTTPLTPITRIRQAADLLERVNETTNRNQAVFWLRSLAARLCSLSVKDMLGAKNLQPEIRDLSVQLTRFLNGPLRKRLLVLSRLIVRNLTSLLGKPNVIDRLWNDTIDLAEIHIQGSAIVNELRRTSHHALGKRTLQIAEAYLAYLKNGETGALEALGFAAPSKADVDARKQPENTVILERVIEDLQRLLGTSQIVTRIEEWKETYAEVLLRCEFGKSIEDELATIVSDGIGERNRWVYLHHLRILRDKVDSFRQPADMGSELRAQLDEAVKEKPDAKSFDPGPVTRALEQSVRGFVAELRHAHEEPLFEALGSVIESYRSGRNYEVFDKTRALRGRVVAMIENAGFDEQRDYLCRLEGLLEEMGYLALRHVASRYQEKGVDLAECLQIVRSCTLNLRYDGLFSRELIDFAEMLTDSTRTDDELLNVLENIERVYHRVRQRVTVPYEKMQQRLGLDDHELRLILANMLRYMHDLNSMVHFADIAATTIREQQAKGKVLFGREHELALADVDDPVLHISHRSEIARWIEQRDKSLRDRYGAKGSGLLYISYLNLPTRDGFILPTTYGRAALHRAAPARLRGELEDHLRTLERDIAQRTGVEKRFGGGENPLVLAVRGGSVFSMPGILYTVVFVGMNDEIAERLAQDGPWRAYDSYRRFLASYATAVWNVDLEQYDLVDKAKQRHGVRYKQELPWQAMKEVAEESKQVLRELGLGKELDAILADPFSQLVGAVNAVFDSWETDTAARFRDIKGICHSWHTAVSVQEMAFGNRTNASVEPGLDETKASLTGVIPRTFPTDAGVRAFEGEIKFSAAGDDLVSGMTYSDSFRSIGELDQLMPTLETRLKHAVAKLRRFMGTDQEVEFTVERGVLSVLQTRRAEARRDQATDRFLDPGDPATRGLGVRGGGFRGMVAFDDADLSELSAVDLTERDDVDGVLLVIENPTPADIPMIISADGLLTARGGSTSHAAVAINGIENRDYSGVVSAMNLDVDVDRHEAIIRGDSGEVLYRLKTGDVVSIHGTTGDVYIGSRRIQRTN